MTADPNMNPTVADFLEGRVGSIQWYFKDYREWCSFDTLNKYSIVPLTESYKQSFYGENYPEYYYHPMQDN